MQRDAIDFGSDNIPKLFGKMLMPTLLGMLCISLMTVIDGVFIGHGVGSDALAVSEALTFLLIFISRLAGRIRG